MTDFEALRIREIFINEICTFRKETVPKVVNGNIVTGFDEDHHLEKLEHIEYSPKES